MVLPYRVGDRGGGVCPVQREEEGTDVVSTLQCDSSGVSLGVCVGIGRRLDFFLGGGEVRLYRI